jgi:23S rRNA (cytosine1962-C5)-methyltransferase
LATAILKRGRDRRLRLGHLWIYESEIDRVEGAPPPGGVIRVRDSQRHYLGTGYFNPKSNIRVRILTRDKSVQIQKSFLEERIGAAIAFRERIYPGEEVCRLVYAEGDFLPGLIVDRYGKYLSLQLTTAGMDRLRDDAVDILRDRLSPAGIYERSDSPVRRHEALPSRTGWLHGDSPGDIQVTMDGVRFLVNPETDQKTGGACSRSCPGPRSSMCSAMPAPSASMPPGSAPNGWSGSIPRPNACSGASSRPI